MWTSHQRGVYATLRVASTLRKNERTTHTNINIFTPTQELDQTQGAGQQLSNLAPQFGGGAPDSAHSEPLRVFYTIGILLGEVGWKDAGIDQAEADLIAKLDVDGRLHRLIAREWLKAVQGSENRAVHPLRYVFGPEFTTSVSELTGTSLQRIAWVAAMVGCGRAPALQGIDPHQLRQSSTGSAQQVVRTRDGAKAWRAKLNGEGASRVHYWQRPDGLIEFAAVGVHDAIGPLA